MSTKLLRAGLYFRVSTPDQSHALQVDELMQAAKQRGYIPAAYLDTGSGTGKRLPERDRLLADARAGRLDVVLCWRFDRFARSSRDLLDALERFREWGVEFVSMREGIDTATAAGKMVFTVVAALAEFERELIRERVRAGLAAARRRGQRLGRPRRDVDVDAAARRLDGGEALRQVARSLGVPPRTLRRALGRDGAKTPSGDQPQVAETMAPTEVAEGRGEK